MRKADDEGRAGCRVVALALLMVAPGFAADGAVPEASQQGAGPAFEQGYDRPARTPSASRSPAFATHGMVAASQPLAAQVGLEILRDGGNAIDAAVAVNAMLGLVEPHMNGVGGDLFALVWHAASGQLFALNGTGRSPYALDAEVFRQRGLDRVPDRGLLSWTVPGAVDGWIQLLERFGTRSLAELLAPAIGYASEGFPVSEIIAGQWQDAGQALAEWPDSASTFLPGGRAPRPGEIFTNPNLARTYAAIAAGGADAFYRGAIARRLVAFSEANGGFLSMRDLAEHTSTWVEPVSTTYRGYEIWQLPPNSHGITALMMLNMLEGFDLRAAGHNSARALHLMIEAKKLAFADRSRYVADPDFNPLPVQELISKPYGARRARLIDPDRAATTVTAGDPLENSETVYLTVVDGHGNAVSLIQSNFGAFGSKVVPGDLGFVMQNRGTGFSLEPDHLNFLHPHKRSLHTNMPGIVTRGGKPWLSYGVMGGNMQPQGHVQVLSNLIDFGMNVQEAGDAARFRHFGGDNGGVVVLESGVPESVVAALRALGHDVRRGDGGSMGGYQAILIDPDTGVLRGGSDPRKDGLAIGY